MNDRSAVVIGCGIMGCDIAAIFLAGGWSVQLVGHSPSKWVGAQERIAKSVQQLGSQRESGSLVFHSRIEDISWANVHIVLESVTENMEIKKSIFSTLDRLAPAGVPMGSNSSSMRITDICAGLKTAERMANTHFFQPAHLVPLVEIAKGERTEASTLDALHQVFRSAGRAPVRVNRDVPGFLANRIQHALMREAFAVIDEGLATAEDVDVAVRFGFGFRYAAAGPMLLKEFAGFDTQHAAATVIYPSLCNDSAPGKTLTDLVTRGRLGVKAKKGFRDWTDEAIAEERQRYETALMQAANILVLSRPHAVSGSRT